MVRVIGVVSGKGGVGKTTLVANLGTVLANKYKKNVVIVDCNITTSHLGFYIGMYYCPVTLNDVLRGKADIRTAIYDHVSGLKLIPASLSLDDMKGVDISKLGENINKLTSLFGKVDIILLDAAPGLGREAVVTLKASDEVIFVTTPYVPSVVDIIKCKQVAEENGVKALGIVLNMAFKEKHELTISEIEELTETPVIATVPFDKEVLRSLSVRVPVTLLDERSKSSREFIKLSAMLVGEEHRPPGMFDWITDFFKPKPKPSRIGGIKETIAGYPNQPDRTSRSGGPGETHIQPETIEPEIKPKPGKPEMEILDETLQLSERPTESEMKKEAKTIPRSVSERSKPEIITKTLPVKQKRKKKAPRRRKK